MDSLTIIKTFRWLSQVAITKNELKSVKTLLTKKGRRDTGLFVAEGIRLMEEALRHRYLPETVYFAPALVGRRGEQLAARMARNRVAVREVSNRELLAMADTESPQGMLGVFRIPPMRLTELYKPGLRRLLWCENVSDPGNLGTLARSALAFGFDLLVLSGSSADIFGPKVVRSSAGAVFGLKIAKETTSAVIKFAAKNRIKVVASGPTGKKLDPAVKKVLKREKLILVVGSEARGVSRALFDVAEMVVAVGHSKKVESLNVGVAGSILMSMIYSIDTERV